MKNFEIKKILVPVDFSITALKACDVAVELSKKTKSRILLQHVVENLQSTSDPAYFTIVNEDVEKDMREISLKNLNLLAGKLRSKIQSEIEIVSSSGRTHREITDLAKSANADIIVMGTHGASGFHEFLAGTNTFRVVHDASCPVISVPNKITSPVFKKILVPFRDKAHSREKVDFAMAMAKIYTIPVHVLGIDTEGDDENFNKIKLESEQIKNIAADWNVECTTDTVRQKYSADYVIDYASKIKADLLMAMSDMDRVSANEIFLGPFVQQVVNHSKIPVMTIRPAFNTDTVDLRFY